MGSGMSSLGLFRRGREHQQAQELPLTPSPVQSQPGTTGTAPAVSPRERSQSIASDLPQRSSLNTDDETRIDATRLSTPPGGAVQTSSTHVDPPSAVQTVVSEAVTKSLRQNDPEILSTLDGISDHVSIATGDPTP